MLGVKVTDGQYGNTTAVVASSAGDLLGIAGHTIEGPTQAVRTAGFCPRGTLMAQVSV